MDDVGFGVLGVKGGAKDAVFLELLSHHTVVDESCAMELRQNQPSDEHQFHRVPDRDPLKKRLQNQLSEGEEGVNDPVGKPLLIVYFRCALHCHHRCIPTSQLLNFHLNSFFFNG